MKRTTVSVLLATAGMAIAARIPMIATTIINSIKVNPRRPFRPMTRLCSTCIIRVHRLSTAGSLTYGGIARQIRGGDSLERWSTAGDLAPRRTEHLYCSETPRPRLARFRSMKRRSTVHPDTAFSMAARVDDRCRRERSSTRPSRVYVEIPCAQQGSRKSQLEPALRVAVTRLLRLAHLLVVATGLAGRGRFHGSRVLPVFVGR